MLVLEFSHLERLLVSSLKLIHAILHLLRFSELKLMVELPVGQTEHFRVKVEPVLTVAIFVITKPFLNHSFHGFDVGSFLLEFLNERHLVLLTDRIVF